MVKFWNTNFEPCVFWAEFAFNMYILKIISEHRSHFNLHNPKCRIEIFWIQNYLSSFLKVLVLLLSTLAIVPGLQTQLLALSLCPRTTDTRPMKPFLLKSGFFVMGQTNSGAFGVFLAKLSAPILVQWVPCPIFPLFNHYFYKNYVFVST